MQYITGPQPTQADALLYPLTLTAERARDMSATQPYLDVGYSMVVLKNPETTSPFIFANPFTPYAWLAILGALVATVIALIITDGVTRHARLRAIERVHGYRRARKQHRKERAAEYALEATFMVLGAGSTPTSPSWSTRLVFIGWGIVAVILLATYTANLTANLTVSQLATPFKTLEEMSRDSNVRFAVVVNGSIETYFRTSSDRVARSLVDRMELFPNNAEAVGAVRDRDNPVFAAMLDYPVAVWWATQPPCDLALGADTFGPGALVMAFPKGSPLAEPLSASLLRLTDDGTVAELRREWLSTASCGGAAESEVAGEQTSLGVESIWGIFFVLAIIVALAALYACGEVLFYRRFYKGQVDLLPRSPTVMRLRSLLTGTPSSLTRSGSGGGGGGAGGAGGGAGAGLLRTSAGGEGVELGYVRDASLKADDLKELRRQHAGAGSRSGGDRRAAAAAAAVAGGAAVVVGARRSASGAGGGSRTPSVRFSLGGGTQDAAALDAAAASAGGAGPTPFGAANGGSGGGGGGGNVEYFDDTSSGGTTSDDDGMDTASTSDGTSDSSYADARGGGGGGQDEEDPFTGGQWRRGDGPPGGGPDDSQEERGVRSLLRRLMG
jgi:ABC-type amino acid transport substrate-binding protein